MKQLSSKTKTRLKIAGATITAVFSLFSLFTATLAWFASNSTVTASAGSVTVKAPDGVNFDLYYLHHFAIDQSTTKDGNYNTSISAFSGYENAASNAVFEKVLLDEDGVVVDNQGDPVSENDNPTMINHLWPAHRLTYAVVVTEGRISTFTLDSWAEETNNTIKTKDAQENDVLISLSWAINIYGSVSFVTSTNDVLDDLSTGFTSYSSAVLSDAFNYSQASPAPAQHSALPIVPSIGTSQQNERTIVYFSIEFSDDNDTYYSLNTETGYYTKNTSGNSNCYESLILKDLIFKLA